MRLRQRIFILLLGIAAVMACSSAVADVVTDLTPMGARSYGMGQTGVNTSTDSFAAFINPANLALKRNRPHVELLNAQAEADLGGFTSAAGRKGSALSLGSVYPYLKSNTGEWAGYRYSIFPNFTSRIFSFGILYEQMNAGKYDKRNLLIPDDTDKVTHKGLRRIMPTASLSFRMFGGILKFGYSLGLDYLGLTNSVVSNPDTKQLSYNNGIQEGFAVRNTAGLTLTLPIVHLPSFSFVARDIGKARYHGGSYREVTPMTFDAGVSQTIYFGKFLELTVTGDYRDMTNQLQTGSRMRRLFTGTEIRLGRAFSLRGGFSQGYPSAGLGFKMKNSKFDLSYYQSEMGGRLREDGDKRFLMQIVWSLGGKAP